MGVRMALGATQSAIVRLVLGEAARAVMASALVGLVAAVALGPTIEALLYDVKPGDPSTMALAALALTCVALLASYMPIRRMLAQNPVASLKND